MHNEDSDQTALLLGDFGYAEEQSLTGRTDKDLIRLWMRCAMFYAHVSEVMFSRITSHFLTAVDIAYFSLLLQILHAYQPHR